MTSQPEDKFVELARLESNYTSIYRSSFGINPPSGTKGGHSPSDNPGEIGTKELEEGRVDEDDLRGVGLVEGEGEGGGGGGGGGGDLGVKAIGPEVKGTEDDSPSDPRPQEEQSADKSVNPETSDPLNSDSDSDISNSNSNSPPEEEEEDEPSEEENSADETPQPRPPRSPSQIQASNEKTIEWIKGIMGDPSVKNVIVLAGAGISTSAGIPDFRSPKTGLYANLQKFDLPVPEAIFDIGFFKRKPEPFYVLCKDLYPGKHLPTPAHYFFRLLEEHGKLLRIFTQNIDTLERISGIPSEKIVEAHGSFATSHCIGCRAEVGEEQMKEEIRVNDGKPVRCKKCGDLVKPDIVFFGEGLPQRFFKLAMKDLPKCDLLIVVGTSLQVHPFASLVSEVSPSCPRLLINREAVGEAVNKWDEDGFRFESRSRDRFYEGDADAGVRDLAKALNWENELDRLMSTHHTELRSRWGLAGSSAATTTTASSSETETLDKLAADLKKVGLGGNL